MNNSGYLKMMYRDLKFSTGNFNGKENFSN